MKNVSIRTSSFLPTTNSDGGVIDGGIVPMAIASLSYHIRIVIGRAG